MNRLKDNIAFAWTGNRFVIPFLTGWVLSTTLMLVLTPTNIVQLALIIIAIFFIIHRIDKWARSRTAQMYVDLVESGRFDELKKTLMEEASRMAKQNKQRKLLAYCYECECQIFKSDGHYIDGPGHTYCMVCCDDLEEQEKKKKDKTCMCWTCGVKFAPWTIVCNGEPVGECTGCCISCADLGGPTEDPPTE